MIKELQKLINKWEKEADFQFQQHKKTKDEIKYLLFLTSYSRLRDCIDALTLLLKKRSSKRRRVSPKGKQSNVRKADVARSAKRRKE